MPIGNLVVCFSSLNPYNQCPINIFDDESEIVSLLEVVMMS